MKLRRWSESLTCSCASERKELTDSRWTCTPRAVAWFCSRAYLAIEAIPEEVACCARARSDDSCTCARWVSLSFETELLTCPRRSLIVRRAADRKSTRL